MSRDFIRRLKVGVQGGFLDVATAGGPSGIDVDGGQRLGVVDHDRPARWQGHLPAIGKFDLTFNLIAVKKRDVVLVLSGLVDELRHDLLQKALHQLEGAWMVDEDFIYVAPEVITQGANDDVALLKHQEWRGLFPGGTLDGIPKLEQVVEIPLQFFDGFATARRTYDQPHAFGNLQRRHDLTHVATCIAFDTSRYAARAWVVWHQDQITSGEADIRGERCALGAALFLFDLDQ